YVALATKAGAPVTDTTVWAPFDPRDGLDGPGSRPVAGEKKLPAYLQIERLKIEGCAILDQDGKPILYFPARSTSININQPANGGPSYIGSGVAAAKFDADHNWQFFTRFDDPLQANAVKRIQAQLGDLNFNGVIDTTPAPGESPAANGSYILWAAGSDGFYGPNTKPSTQSPTVTDVSKCDDIVLSSQ